MKRRENWRVHLGDYLAGIGHTAFAYGRHDCALFAAGAVQAMTGTDLAAEFREGYGGLKQGLTTLQQAGYADHVALLEAHLTEVAPAFAHVGDVVTLAPEDGVVPLGILLGEAVACLAPSGAVGFVRRDAVQRAFQVP